MATIRVEHNKNYTVMSNHHLRNNKLSLKAKGLLSYMLSLPEDWDYTIAGLSMSCKDGVDSIRSAIAELEATGYMSRSRLRSEDGTYRGTEYIVREYPISDEPIQENPIQVKPIQVKRSQLNTNIQSTNKLNTNQQSTKESKESEADFQQYPSIPFPGAKTAKVGNIEYPTIEEVIEYAESRGRVDLAERFFDYYDAADWHDRNGSVIRSWKQKFISWELNTPKSQNHINKNQTVPKKEDDIRQIMEDRDRMERFRKKLQEEANNWEG